MILVSIISQKSSRGTKVQEFPKALRWIVNPRAGIKDGTGGDEDDQVDVWCVPERKKAQHWTEKSPRCEAIRDAMRRCRLRWHGHVERKDDADYVKACTRLVVERTAPVGRLKNTCQNTVSRHAYAKSWPSGRPRLDVMEGYRTVMMILCLLEKFLLLFWSERLEEAHLWILILIAGKHLLKQWTDCLKAIYLWRHNVNNSA